MASHGCVVDALRGLAVGALDGGALPTDGSNGLVVGIHPPTLALFVLLAELRLSSRPSWGAQVMKSVAGLSSLHCTSFYSGPKCDTSKRFL